VCGDRGANQRYKWAEEDANGANGAVEGAGDHADHGVDETTDDGRAGQCGSARRWGRPRPAAPGYSPAAPWPP